MEQLIPVVMIAALLYIGYRLFKKHQKPELPGPIKEEPGYPPVPVEDNQDDYQGRPR